MTKGSKFLVLGIAFILINAVFVLPAFASEIDGTIDTIHGYAWGENIGWVDFGSSQGNVHVYDSELVGYAWGENIGWISLNCSNTNSCDTVSYKVSNNSQGNLSGYAWGENIGWVDFTNVTINTSGVFSGYGWGENIGWISLNCKNTNSCDTNDYKITTDWRPQSERKAVSVSSNEISKLLELKYIESEEEITNTKKVVFKVETRTKVITKKGEAEVVVPDSTEVVRSDGGKMDFTKLTVEDSSEAAAGVEDQDVVSAVQYGIPEVSLSFNKPITISIPVDSLYNGKTLNIHTSKSATRDWKFLTTCDVLNSTCVFNTTTASYFAVTKRRGGGGLPSGSYNPPTPPSAGFSVLINSGDEVASSRRVTLAFNASPDVTNITVSNYPDFNDAILENYTPIKEWDLCSETGGLIILPNCREGVYTVYVKFYTKWGRASETVSDSIIFRLPKTATTSPVIARDYSPEAISKEKTAETPIQEVEEQGEVFILPVIPQPLPAIPPTVILRPSPSELDKGQASMPSLSLRATKVPTMSEQGPKAISNLPPFVIPVGEKEAAQEELVSLYERAVTAPNALVAAVSNVRLMYGEITRSVLFTTLYVLLLSALLFICGREVRRWHI